MIMSKIKTAAATVALAAAVATPLVMQYQTNTQLREENHALREQMAQLDELKRMRTENDRLTKSLSATNEAQLLELMRLRGQAASWRTREAELAQVQAENRQLKALAPKPAAAPTEATRIPAETWANVGFATPAATFQTVNWALANRDTNVLASALMWADESTRAQAEAAFAATPESFRARYGSLDSFIYDALMGMSNATGFRILNQIDQGDRSFLAVQKDLANGGTQRERTQFQRDGDNYKQVIVPGMADKMIQGALPPASTGKP